MNNTDIKIYYSALHMRFLTKGLVILGKGLFIYLDDVCLLQRRRSAAQDGRAAAREQQEGRHESGAPVQDVGERAAVHHERPPAALALRTVHAQVTLYGTFCLLLQYYILY